MHSRNAVLAVGLLVTFTSGWASAQQAYRLTDLGTLGGTGSLGLAMNDSGQVTGFATTADGVEHAFLWDGAALRDLDFGEFNGMNSYSAGLAINAAGQVTGNAHTTMWTACVPVGRQHDAGPRNFRRRLAPVLASTPRGR